MGRMNEWTNVIAFSFSQKKTAGTLAYCMSLLSTGRAIDNRCQSRFLDARYILETTGYLLSVSITLIALVPVHVAVKSSKLRKVGENIVLRSTAEEEIKTRLESDQVERTAKLRLVEKSCIHNHTNTNTTS